MATDVKVSLTIEGTDAEGKKSSMKIPYINPNISNETMKDFAEMCAELSTDTYTGTTKTTEEDITNGGEGGGLEDAGYTFWTNNSELMPAGVAQLSKYSGEELSFELQIVSKHGRGYYSGVEALTFSGKKPKGTELSLFNGKFLCEFTGATYDTTGQDTTLQQLQIHIAPTETAKGATLYLYFDAKEADMEEA